MEAEARAALGDLGFHEVLPHVYTPGFTDSRAAYIFSSRLEFNHYFNDNFLFLQPNQTQMAIISVLDDGTVIASKWACDKIITAQKKKRDPRTIIDKTCGTCEYCLTLEDIKQQASEAGEEYYDTMQAQIGSCCLGKTPEEQQRCKYSCDQYKPDYDAIEKKYRVYTISSRRRRS